MERKIFRDFSAWKEAAADRKPLLLLGARQVGKTWAMREFGRRNYKHVAYVNCDTEPLAAELFRTDYDIPRILLALQAITGVPIEPGRTLIILDELQEAPRGMHCLKYFAENAPEHHVMAAGSLLGITLGRGESFPVGKVHTLHMFPLDFGEFLLAAGEEQLYNLLQEQDWETMRLLDIKYVEMLRRYYFVGGMPEADKTFFQHHDASKVRAVQRRILSDYRKDISKHTTAHESMRIGLVMNALPSQLAKENKKFVYSALKKGARASEFEVAIQWLCDAGLVHRVSRVNELRIPLKFYEDFNAFKLFFLDCGLLACLSNAPAAQMLIGDSVFTEFKGAFTEQYVLQQMVANNIAPFYWSKANSSAEVDFIVQDEASIVPIEVKAEANVRSRSLAEVVKANASQPMKAVRFSMQDYIVQDWMKNIPLYGVSAYLQTLSATPPTLF